MLGKYLDDMKGHEAVSPLRPLHDSWDTAMGTDLCLLYPSLYQSSISKSCITKEKLYKLWKEDAYNIIKREEYKKFTIILKIN